MIKLSPSIAPALCGATGIIVAALLGALAYEAAWPLQYAAALALVPFLLVADLLAARAHGSARRFPSWTSVVLALCYAVAMLLSAVNGMAVLMIPILGGGVIASVPDLYRTPPPKA